MAIELRPYQSQLIDGVRDLFAAHVRQVLMVAPTGSGKTVMFSSLAERVSNKGNNILILVHREELIDQVSRTLDAFGVEHSFMAVNRPYNASLNVQVASVFSTLKRLSKTDWRPSMVIVDEAHHATAGSTWGKVLAAVPGAYVLGVTATPERLGGEGLRATFAEMLLGPTVRELIDLGALCDFKVYAPEIDIDDVPKRAGDYAQDKLAKAMDKPKLTGDALTHYKRLADGKRALAFCVSLEHAQHVADQFRSAGYRAARIDGSLAPEVRRQMVADFTSGKIEVLTSCEIVAEGFDLPAIECAILLRPTHSLGLHLQQVGRALRPFPGKPHAIILDHANNSRRHGLPDEVHDWSLDGRKKRKKGADSGPPIRTCGGCFAAVAAACLSCRYCGFVFPVKPREIKRVDGKLTELKTVERKPVTHAEMAEARTMQQLVQLGQQRGMKNAGFWAMKVFNARHKR